MIKLLALVSCVALLSACTGTQRQPASKPTSEPAPQTGVSISGYARYGVVKRG
ncbi:hypothetical protein RD1_1593 [Roseobacter denitrificans OCh 114]|uniref:Lipoprotein n=1 Tax=Roseobacter denitrificans (strain ATCC 33942 / OCh 114) TaxID=375451 RepID=Q169X3_ROSDO|nr:hypothetical protein RD1_1593 [Roseobacter denitrificans OCh 114]